MTEIASQSGELQSWILDGRLYYRQSFPDGTLTGVLEDIKSGSKTLSWEIVNEEWTAGGSDWSEEIGWTELPAEENWPEYSEDNDDHDIRSLGAFEREIKLCNNQFQASKYVNTPPRV